MEGDRAIRVEGDASGSALITGEGNTVNVQFGVTAAPASFRARVKRFLSYYLGSEDRPVAFGGRDAQLGQLDAWLADLEAPPNLLIAAPAGRGKTALLVRWLQRVDTTAWPVAFVPISIRFGTNRPDIFYQALATRLAEILGESLQDVKGDAAAVYKDKVVEQLDAFAGSGKRCLLVVDGLDEATGWQVDTSILPPEPVQGLRIVVGARILADDGGAQDWLPRLGWKAHDTRILEVPQLDREGIADVLRGMGVPLAGLAGDVDLLDELERLTEGDPLLLRFYVEDLWENRDQASGLRPEDLRGREAGFGAYFKEWLAKQGGIYLAQGAVFDEQTINAILVILACALGPLQLADLVHLVRRLLGSERLISRDSLEPIQRFLIGGPGEGGYVLGHPKLGEYLREDFFGGSEDVARAREALVAWGSDTARRLNAGELEPGNAPHYLLQFYAQHLKESNAEPDRFLELVEDGWRRAWEDYEGGLQGFANDVRTAWDAIKSGRSGDASRSLGAQLRCALCLSSLHSLGSAMPPALLAAALVAGKLSWRHALHLAELEIEPLARMQKLAATASAPDLPPEQRPEILAEAFAAARSISNQYSRARNLLALVPHLPPEQRPAALAETIDAARRIATQDSARTLVELAPLLPPEQRPELMAEALAAVRGIGDQHRRAAALTGLVPHLPPEQRPAVAAEALAPARASAGGVGQASALADLAPHLPPQQRRAALDEALAAARGIVGESSRVYALVAPASRLPPEQRPAVLAEALAAAQSIGDQRLRALALHALAPHLPPEQRPAVLAEAFTAARAITDDFSRAGALADLARHLPPELLAEALATARNIRDELGRARALTGIATHLPLKERPAVLAEALAAARGIADGPFRSSALADLAPQLPPELLAEALAAARSIADEGHFRAHALNALAPHLPPELLAEALAAARAIGDQSERAETLGIFAPQLPAEERLGALSEALTAARRANGYRRARALAALAPHLSTELLAEALAVARDIGNGAARARALAALAPHVPPGQGGEVLAEGLAAARSSTNQDARAQALGLLARHLPAELLAEALTAARRIHDHRRRAEALGTLVPHVPPEQRPLIVAEALAATGSSTNGHARAWALVNLAPHLPADHLAEALAAAGAIGNDRPQALASLAPHLPPEQRPGILAEALAGARAIGNRTRRAQGLAALAPHLPAEECPAVLEQTIEDCAGLRRDEALRIVAALAQALRDFGGEPLIRETVRAIRDVGRWWP